MCRVDGAMWYPDTWLNINRDMSMRGFLDEINIELVD